MQGKSKRGKMMKGYAFLQNRDCEYFPCHADMETEAFNCLFCYCPLYGLKETCGGDFRYLKDGTKDCSQCRIPHQPDGYAYISKYKNELLELGKRRDNTEHP